MNRMPLMMRRAASASKSMMAAAVSVQNIGFRSLHLTSPVHRGRSGINWYFDVLKKIEAKKSKAVVPPYPEETLHEKERKRVALYFQTVEDAVPSRIVLELTDDITPRTVENFLEFCRRPAKHGYVGTTIHRIQKNFALHCGNIFGMGERGGHSAFTAQYFADENYIVRHTEPGVVGMINSGVHTNANLFYITAAPAVHLDGRNVAFGKVISGLDVVSRYAKVYTKEQRPTSAITLVKCEEIHPGSDLWITVDKEIAAIKANEKAKREAEEKLAKKALSATSPKASPSPKVSA